MTIKSHDNFRLEIIRLLKLYNAGVLSFKEQSSRTTDLIRSSDPNINPKNPVYLNGITEDQYLIAGNLYELGSKLNNRFLANLREVLIVRLISALEVYLVDMVREIFIKRKDLFHSGQKMEFSHGELLSSENIAAVWTKLINKECRKLQNQGFLEIKKFYKRSFDIDFSNYNGDIKFIEQLHDQRHLLVHRLGKVDKQYQHKYNSTEKLINFKNEDFYSAVNAIKLFGQFILDGYNSLIEEDQNEPKFTNKLHSHIRLYLINDEPLELLNNERSFIIGDEIVRLKDIIKSLEFKGEEVKVNLFGDSSHIKHFYKLLKKQANNGNLTIEEKNLSLSTHQTITENDIKKIRKRLPENKPYPESLNTVLAAELKMPVDKVTEILKRL